MIGMSERNVMIGKSGRVRGRFFYQGSLIHTEFKLSRNKFLLIKLLRFF